jgi:hypothetical protein
LTASTPKLEDRDDDQLDVLALPSSTFAHEESGSSAVSTHQHDERITQSAPFVGDRIGAASNHSLERVDVG